MSLASLFLFASIYFVAVASPGPGLAAVVARGLAQGNRGAVPFIAGFVVGDLIWLTLATTGLALIAQTFEHVFTLIKYAGCAYLLSVAWTLWHAPVAAGDVVAEAAHARPVADFLGSLMLTLGNPKVIVFFMSLMPLVVDMNAITPLIYLQLMAMAFLVLTPVLVTALFMAERARRVFTSEKALRRMNRGTAGIMAGAAVAIAAKS